jgi:hypothetical protein
MKLRPIYAAPQGGCLGVRFAAARLASMQVKEKLQSDVKAAN